jgi:hypothetical protein
MQYTGSSTNSSESISVPDFLKSHTPIQPVLSHASFSRRGNWYIPSVLGAGATPVLYKDYQFTLDSRLHAAMKKPKHAVGQDE